MSPSQVDIHRDIDHVLFSEEEISAKVKEMGSALAEEYKDKRPLVLVVLNGAFVFASDLVRAIHPLPLGLEVQFTRVSSYGSGTVSNGEVTLHNTVSLDMVQDRHVIVVEDIVDSGHTLQKLLAALRAAGAASLATAVLLDKAERRAVELQPDHTAFVCPNEFVVGYGLDFDEHYRSLPYIGVLKPELYLNNSSSN